MRQSEVEWAKKHGLKRTEHTVLEHGKERRVYRASNDKSPLYGSYYYRSRNAWCGVFEEYFFK